MSNGQMHPGKAKFFIARKDWTEITIAVNGKTGEGKHKGNTLTNYCFPVSLSWGGATQIWHHLSLMPSFHSNPHLLLAEHRGEGDSSWAPEPEHLPLISPTPIASCSAQPCSRNPAPVQKGREGRELLHSPGYKLQWGQTNVRSFQCEDNHVVGPQCSEEYRETSEVSCCRT